MKIIKNILMIVGLLLQVGIGFASNGRAILNRIEAEASQSDDYDWENSGPTAEDIRAGLEAAKVKTLADKGSLEDKLMSAVKNGDLENVKDLIAAGADVNVKDSLNCTVLAHAVYKDNAEIVKLLIVNGAAKKEKNLKEVFMSAVFHGNNEVVKALLIEGASIDDDILNTADSFARIKCSAEVVNAIKELLQKRSRS